MKPKTFIFIFLCGWLFFAVSCSKEKQIDRDLLLIDGGSGAYSFLQTGNIVYLNGNGYSLDKNFLGMPIILSEAAGSADTVTAVVDGSLVATYNRLHNERNPELPVAAFGVSNLGRFPVRAGDTELRDSLHATLLNGVALVHNTVYLVPVRLTAGRNTKLKTTVVYFKVLFTVAQLNARMQGASVLPNRTVGGPLIGGLLNLFYGNGCPDSLKFRVATNAIFPIHETQVQAALLSDRETDSIVRANNIYATRMPSQVYSLTKSVVNVPVNSVLSRDSIVVRFTNKELIARGSYSYMGLKIVQYRGSDYGVAPLAADTSKVLVRILVP